MGRSAHTSEALASISLSVVEQALRGAPAGTALVLMSLTAAAGTLFIADVFDLSQLRLRLPALQSRHQYHQYQSLIIMVVMLLDKHRPPACRAWPSGQLLPHALPSLEDSRLTAVLCRVQSLIRLSHFS
jgi:hypothetical protein